MDQITKDALSSQRDQMTWEPLQDVQKGSDKTGLLEECLQPPGEKGKPGNRKTPAMTRR